MWTTIMNRVILSTIVLLTLVPTLAAQSQPSYAKQVRPFLAKYCLECHNAKSAKLGLNLETVKAILEGSDGGPVLEPGRSDASRIVLLVEGKDKPIMPPKEAKFHPKKDEIGILRAWVAAGAKDDSAAIKVVLPEIKPRKNGRAPVTALAYNSAGDQLWVGTGFLGCYRLNQADTGPFRHIDRGRITALAVAKADEWLLAGVTAPGETSLAQLWHFPYGPVSTQAFGVDHQDAILDVAI